MSGTARVRVKICGLTNKEDTRAAIDAGADALGFNTWRGGKRFIDLEREASWLAALPPFVVKVALLVNASLEEAEKVARLPFIDALQLHGDEGADYCRALAKFRRPFIKALRPQSTDELANLEQYATPHFLIDAHVPGAFGGTGVQADASLATEFQRRYPHLPLILAGGLKPENVGAIVRAVRPWAVDVSSGVEIQPGKKDPAAMATFVAATRVD